MSLKYGEEKSFYEKAPPSYSEIDEKKPLLSKEPEEQVKQVFGIRRSSFLLSLYLVFYGVYLMTGALVFEVLEAPEEMELRIKTHNIKREFLKENSCIKDEGLENFIKQIMKANSQGISLVGNASSDLNWSFVQSLFFSSTVVTTIGYGRISPVTKAGRTFCIIYAILGIPLTLMLITAIVERLMLPSRAFLNYLMTKLGYWYQAFTIRLFHLWIIFSILVFVFWLVPAALFAYFEPDWDMLDGLYYCFISLTSVGLGDLIPGDSPDQPNRILYKVLTIVYLYIGMIFLIFATTVYYDIPQLNVGLFFLMEADETPIWYIDLERSRSPTASTQEKSTAVKIKARTEGPPSPEGTTPGLTS